MPLWEDMAKLDVLNTGIWVAEARFGFSYIKDYVADLSAGAQVLEIGCGSGLLLGCLNEMRQDINLNGVEPFENSFSSLASFQSDPRIQALNIFKGCYEDYVPRTGFDLIYSINVFEHVEDWRDYLNFCLKHINPGGKCVILCPNYSFPYESHFRLPIIFNKALTYKIFKKRINDFEMRHNCVGLWDSLNFVKRYEFDRFMAQFPKVTTQFKTDIVDDMLERLHADPEFAKRQKFMGSLGAWVSRAGLMRILTWPIVRRFTPYMFIEIKK